MKKYFVLSIVLIFVFSIRGYSQKGKEIVVGAGGFLTSVWIVNQNFYGEPEIDYAPKMGYGGNINYGYYFTKNIALVGEFQYSIQGEKYSGKQTMNGHKYDTERDITLKYFNIPVFFKYAFGTDNTRFRFMLGPQFSFLNSATQTYTRDGKVIGTELTNLDGEKFISDAENIKERFENNDISIAFDLGADISLSKKFFINAGFRVNYGFKDINTEAYRIPDLDNEYIPSHNFWGGLYVGFNYLIDVQGYSQRSIE